MLPPLLRERRIRGRDAGFATELTYGTLRLRGRYDAILATCVDRPLSGLDGALLDVLRLGAHQLLGMRVPVHAAVSETVGLARNRVGAGPAHRCGHGRHVDLVGTGDQRHGDAEGGGHGHRGGGRHRHAPDSK